MRNLTAEIFYQRKYPDVQYYATTQATLVFIQESIHLVTAVTLVYQASAVHISEANKSQGRASQHHTEETFAIIVARYASFLPSSGHWWFTAGSMY